ncbi:hypothetical protein KCP75_13450 [Salmonella enterica subsp. enterica]|nr:hypothetical protein KCP75_13450 [Salmonella enterica subsp. enterica]
MFDDSGIPGKCADLLRRAGSAYSARVKNYRPHGYSRNSSPTADMIHALAGDR